MFSMTVRVNVKFFKLIKCDIMKAIRITNKSLNLIRILR